MSLLARIDYRAPENRERIRGCIYFVGLFALAGFSFAWLFGMAAQNSLWLDEVFQVGFCLRPTLGEAIFADPAAPPLFSIIAWLWYRVVPFGEAWLRLPSIVFVILSMFAVAAAGRRLGGRTTGFIAALLLILNAKVVCELALNFRAYGLFLFLSSLLVYLYIRRIQTPPEKLTWKMSAPLALVMFALAYTHYFGVLFIAVFFAADLYLLARGRLHGARAKVFMPYLACALLFLPWLSIPLTALPRVQGQAMHGDGVSYWQDGGDKANLHELLYWLCGECAEMLGFLNLAIIIICAASIYLVYKKRFDWRKQLPLVVLVFAVLGITAAMTFYATQVNTHTILNVKRYYTPLISCIAIVCAWGITRAVRAVPVNALVSSVASVLCVMTLASSTMATVDYDLSESSSTRFYANLTKFLESRDDIQDSSTCLLAMINTTDRGTQITAWDHYYFKQKDSRDFSIRMWDGLDPSVQLNPYDLLQFDTIYITCQHDIYDIPDFYREVLSTHYYGLSVLEDGSYDSVNVSVRANWLPDGPGGGKTFRFIKAAA